MRGVRQLFLPLRRRGGDHLQQVVRQHLSQQRIRQLPGNADVPSRQRLHGRRQLLLRPRRRQYGRRAYHRRTAPRLQQLLRGARRAGSALGHIAGPRCRELRTLRVFPGQGRAGGLQHDRQLPQRDHGQYGQLDQHDAGRGEPCRGQPHRGQCFGRDAGRDGRGRPGARHPLGGEPCVRRHRYGRYGRRCRNRPGLRPRAPRRDLCPARGERRKL